ncbi:MAG: hypothetical protein WBA88_02855 [Pseudaminobacter sp.]
MVFCLLTKTLTEHIIRTPKVVFIEGRASTHLMALTLIVMAIGVFLPMGPLAEYFKLQALPWPYFFWLVGAVFGYVVLTSLMNRYCIRRFGW